MPSAIVVGRDCGARNGVETSPRKLSNRSALHTGRGLALRRGSAAG